jgi:uncharacterized membrane protein YkgB
MTQIRSTFEIFDARLTRWAARHAVTGLRLSVAVVFLWFGVLKFLPGMSPAQDLAARTLTPLVLFPHETFTVIPIAPTLEGQSIIRNIVLVSAAILLGSTVRGGFLVADPDATRNAREAEQRA